MYAYKSKAGNWFYQVLDKSGDVGLHTSLALDEKNLPHISYYDTTNSDLMYAGPASFCGDGVSAITQLGLKDRPPCTIEKVSWEMCQISF
jgi:hypothetical protein